MESQFVKRNLAFLKGTFTAFGSTGAICSTSPWAARTLCHPIQGDRKPMRILEVGSGTGAVTNQLLDFVTEKDTVVLCEVNDNFYQELQTFLKGDARYLKLQDRITCFQGYIQQLEAQEPFDAIICSLPFLNFDASTVNDIFAKLESLSNPDTLLTYYEYIGIRFLRSKWQVGESAQRFIETHNALKHVLGKFRVRSDQVWMNILPIAIHTLAFKS